MLVVLASLALAEPSDAAPGECLAAEVSVTSPAPLATGVPIDVVPAALLSEQSCGSPGWIGTLIDASTGEEVASVAHSMIEGRVLEVDPGGDLEPETTYTLRFEPDDGAGVITEIGFTTGTGRTVGLEGGPTVESAVVTYRADDQVTLQAEIGVAAAAEGATFVAFGIEGRDPALDWTSATGPTIVMLQAIDWSFSEKPEEVCVTARQRDMAGRWSESPSDCVAPDVVAGPGLGGCLNTTRGAPMGGLLGLLLAAGLARRARR